MMSELRLSMAIRTARLAALAVLALAMPAGAQEDNTRAVRLLDQAPVQPTLPPSAAPQTNSQPPLIPQAPAAAPSPSSLPPLVPPAPTATTPKIAPLLPTVPQSAPAPAPTPVVAPPAAPPPAAPNPVATKPQAPVANAPQSGSPSFNMMSLPPVEVKLPPTPAEIGKLNASLKVANPSALSVEILPGADIAVGSKVAFRISTKKPGYLILLDVDATGKLTQIYPTPFKTTVTARAKANYLVPGKPVQIPSPADGFAGFEFVASPPFGTAMVVAILSDLPVQAIDLPDIPASMTGRADALDYLTKVAGGVRIPAEAGGRLREARWSFDAKFYAIR